MARPAEFTRTHSWLDDQTNAQPLNGTQLDGHFDDVADSINATIDALSEIRADAGGLKPGLIGADQLADDLLDSLTDGIEQSVADSAATATAAASSAIAHAAAASSAQSAAQDAADTATGSVGTIAGYTAAAQAARTLAEGAQSLAEDAQVASENAQNAALGYRNEAMAHETEALRWAELLSGPVMPPDPENPTSIPDGSSQDWIDAVASGHFSARWWAWWISRRQDILGGGLPEGGAAGQVLAKQSETDGDVYWTTLSGEGGGPETDPVFTASPAGGIASGDITNWDTAYGWGDHSLEGYLTSVSWGDIADVPATFAPSAHGHALEDVTGLVSALAAKAATSHGHTISDVSGLQVELDDKADAAHGHSISDVTGLQSQLDGKSDDGHQHTKAQIADFNDADYATAAQGVLAATALQPGEAATPAQGALADTALQPGDVTGVPAGGTTGQVLAKLSNTDHALTWADPAAGGGGGADWSAQVVSSGPVSMVKDTHYHVTAAGITLTLPATPTAGDQVCVSVDAATDTVLARGGELIGGAAEDLTIDVAEVTVTLRYVGGTEGWSVVSFSRLGQSASAPRANLLINGCMRIAQRGTSHTVGSVSVPTLDRWVCASGGATSTTVTQEFDAAEGRYFLRAAKTTAGDSGQLIAQRVDGLRQFSGKTLTFSVLLRSSDPPTELQMRTRREYGTGGSPSPDAFGLVAEWTPTGSWARYEATFTIPDLSGDTFGTDGNDYLEVRLYNSANETAVLDVAEVKLEVGETATAFDARPIGQELALCQRYYQEDIDAGRVMSFAQVGANDRAMEIPFKVTMRAEPTMTITGRTGHNESDIEITKTTVNCYREFVSEGHTVSTILEIGGWQADAEL
jgi:hypothetical protein